MTLSIHMLLICFRRTRIICCPHESFALLSGHFFISLFDYIEIGQSYAIYETPILKSWVGKSILDINVRKIYRINIIAIKKGIELISSPDPHYIFEDSDHIIVIATSKDINALTNSIENEKNR